MAVIAAVNEKGGCTKTTTATHLARWAAIDGFSVALIDCDPQCSSSWWVDSLEGSTIKSYTCDSPDELLDMVPILRTEYDLVTIDGPAGLSEMTRAILLRCDCALVPSLPTGIDIKSVANTIRLIMQARSIRRRGPDASLFLSKAVKNTRLKAESLAVLNDLEVPLLNAVIHDRQIVADSFGQRSTVFDMTGRPAAYSSIEYHNLFKEAVYKWLPVQRLGFKSEAQSQKYSSAHP